MSEPTKTDANTQEPPATGTPTRPISAVKEQPKRNFNVPVAELRRQDLLDVQELQEDTLDSNRHYAWVRDDPNSKSVRRRERAGYTVETYRDGGPKPVAERGDDTGDNVIRMGDTILMSRPKTLHEQDVQARFDASEARLNSTTDTIKQQANEKGVNLIR